LPIKINFNFKPKSTAADPRVLIGFSDGDTPIIQMPIRMVSCDTPEKDGYAGKPETAQKTLELAKQNLSNNFYSNIPQDTKEYFIKKLTNKAAEDHINAGHDASSFFGKILDDRLVQDDGKKRQIAVISTGEKVDIHGRLLAYIAPWFAGTKKDPMPAKEDPRKRTFNLEMIESGWAALFPIYPSLPKDDDLDIAIKAAETAWNKQGIWKKYGKNILLAYEFRMCVKLARAKSQSLGIKKAFERTCVDLRDLSVVGKFEFVDVPPPYRMWIWNMDLKEAIDVLKLKTA
jgi:endonuclease YncB( thermonuclease family)